MKQFDKDALKNLTDFAEAQPKYQCLKECLKYAKALETLESAGATMNDHHQIILSLAFAFNKAYARVKELEDLCKRVGLSVE